MSQEEIFVPKGWKLKIIKNEIADFEKRNPEKNPDREFKYVEIGSVSDDKKIENFRTLFGKNAPSRARNVIRENDVIYGTTRPYYRNVVLIPKKFENEICSTGFCVLRVNSIESKYLFYYMLSDLANNQILKPMHGGNYPAVSNKDVTSIRIPVPEKNETQTKIVKKLDHILGQLEEKKKEIIFSHNKIICELFSTKKNFNIEQNISNFINYTFNQIIHTAFEGKFSSNPNSFDYEKYEKLLKKLDKNKKTHTKRSYHENVVKLLHSSYELPKKWSWIRFDSFSELISGQHILANDYNLTKKGIPYITGPADFGNISPTITKWTEKPKAKAENNDILITVKGAGVGKVNLLNINIAAISRQLMAIRSEDIIPVLVYYYLSSQHHNLAKLAGDWTTVPGIGRESILQLEIPLIPQEFQKETLDAIQEKLKAVTLMENKLKAIFSNYENSIRTIKKINYSVLNSAFSGKLIS
jgi:type I restriction enzyme, S subunit